MCVQCGYACMVRGRMCTAGHVCVPGRVRVHVVCADVTVRYRVSDSGRQKHPSLTQALRETVLCVLKCLLCPPDILCGLHMPLCSLHPVSARAPAVPPKPEGPTHAGSWGGRAFTRPPMPPAPPTQQVEVCLGSLSCSPHRTHSRQTHRRKSTWQGWRGVGVGPAARSCLPHTGSPLAAARGLACFAAGRCGWLGSRGHIARHAPLFPKCRCDRSRQRNRLWYVCSKVSGR